MSAAIWPTFLPPPQLADYKITPKSRTVRTDMDAGTVRVRRRFTRAPTTADAVWVFDQSEFAIFEWWFDNTIDGGAAWSAGPALNGTGRITVQCRFIDGQSGPYEARPLGGCLWRVSAQLEVDQMPKGNLLEIWPVGEPSLSLDFTSQTYKVPQT
jgi:hypothetical protein